MRAEDFIHPHGQGQTRRGRGEQIRAKTLILHNDRKLLEQAREWCRRFEQEDAVIADGMTVFDLGTLQPDDPSVGSGDGRGPGHRFPLDAPQTVTQPDRCAAEPGFAKNRAELVFVAIDPTQRLSDHWRVWLWAWARSRARGRGLLMFLDDCEDIPGDPAIRGFLTDLAVIAGLEFCSSRQSTFEARVALQGRQSSFQDRGGSPLGNPAQSRKTPDRGNGGALS